MAEFSPSELDQLEDRLEDLTATTDVASLGLPPAVAEEMEAYREVLDLVETHLVEEEPTAGVLDDVLAKAHAEVASGSTSTTPVATTRECATFRRRQRTTVCILLRTMKKKKKRRRRNRRQRQREEEEKNARADARRIERTENVFFFIFIVVIRVRGILRALIGGENKPLV